MARRYPQRVMLSTGMPKSTSDRGPHWREGMAEGPLFPVLARQGQQQASANRVQIHPRNISTNMVMRRSDTYPYHGTKKYADSTVLSF